MTLFKTIKSSLTAVSLGISLLLTSCGTPSWSNSNNGKLYDNHAYAQSKSLGPERDNEGSILSEELLNLAKKEGQTSEYTGRVCIKRWNGNKLWVGRELVGGGFQGPYIDSSYYTSKVDVTVARY